MNIALISIAVVAVAGTVASRIARATRRTAVDGLAVGVGTVRTVVNDEPEVAERQIWIEVDGVDGDTFVGQLTDDQADATDLSALRPGLVVLVAFDPAAPEELSLPDDMLAVRASGLALV